MNKHWFALHDKGVYIAVKVVPKSSKNAVDGVIIDVDGCKVLKLRVTSPPDKNKANEAVLRLLADTWNIPISSLSIASGGTGRKKRICINGKVQELMAMLEHYSTTLS